VSAERESLFDALPSPYYQDDYVTLYHGDSRVLVPHLAADVLVTDPPYGVEFKGKATKHTTKKSGGYIGTDDAGVGPAVVALALERVKRGAVFTGNRLLHDYPKPNDIGCVYCPSGAGIGPWGFVCFHVIAFYGPRASNVLGPTSMQSFATVEDRRHPCPKPLSWLRWIIGHVSLPDEIVLDPFAGSGTTLRAAKDHGRKSIGVEIEERYCELAAESCAQEVLAA
jgi:site-specific DNA-methyltransferase (adenine-specific)